MKYSVCAGCRGTTQKICSNCTSKTEQQIHDHYFNKMELFHKFRISDISQTCSISNEDKHFLIRIFNL